MATSTRPVTSLDFDALKADIIAFIKTNPTFSDYAFEGSALNAIADILAYNAHNNAYYANMLHSEGFLDTAQKRASVVSRAKELGYTPKSVTGATAYVDINIANSGSSQIILSRGTAFTSSNDSGSYTFLAAADYSATPVAGSTTYSASIPGVKLVNGVYLSNYFRVDTTANLRSLFTIPNKNVDISTLRVFVADSDSSLEKVEYKKVDNLFESLPTSLSYFIQESYDGYFQIYFGENVLGKQPVNDNIIYVDYFAVSDIGSANECRLFGFDGVIGGTSSLVTINTTQVSFGGSDKEDINSIRTNAKKSNSAKNRSVTASDYELILTEQFPFIKAASVWGGEDNQPPIYGKIFASIQPVAGYTLSDSVKQNRIMPELRKMSMMTITPVIVDPSYLGLELVTTLKFNPSKTVNSLSVVEGAVLSTIADYVSNISKFNTDLLHSNLVSSVISVDPGIVSASIEKSVSFRIAPLLNIATTHTKYLNNSVKSGSVKSTKFNFFHDSASREVSIREISGDFTTSISSNGTVNIIQRLGLFSDAGELLVDIGFVNLGTGYFEFSFGLYSYLTTNRFIQINATLDVQDLSTTRNQILTLNSTLEDSIIGLVSNNQIKSELYIK